MVSKSRIEDLVRLQSDGNKGEIIIESTVIVNAPSVMSPCEFGQFGQFEKVKK
jgi:hypothetical protein